MADQFEQIGGDIARVVGDLLSAMRTQLGSVGLTAEPPELEIPCVREGETSCDARRYRSLASGSDRKRDRFGETARHGRVTLVGTLSYTYAELLLPDGLTSVPRCLGVSGEKVRRATSKRTFVCFVAFVSSWFRDSAHR